MYHVRPYSESDLPILQSWWRITRNLLFPGSLMPATSSYVLEIDGQPALAGSMYYSNSENFCMIDNLIGNPELSGAERRRGTWIFLQCAEELAHSRGYNKLFCMTSQQGLTDYYRHLGFQVTCQNVTTFTKEL